MGASKSSIRLLKRDFLFLPLVMSVTLSLMFIITWQIMPICGKQGMERYVNTQIGYFNYENELEPKNIISNQNLSSVFKFNFFFFCASNMHHSGNKKKEGSPTPKIVTFLLVQFISLFLLHSYHLLSSLLSHHSLHSFIHSFNSHLVPDDILGA